MKLSAFNLRTERDEAAERERLSALLRTVNQTETPYPKDKTVSRVFAEQARKTPDAAAVIYDERELSYRELDKRATRLARALVEQGIGPEDALGIMLDQSPAAVIAVLASLKAGGAYLPFSPDLPSERIRHILRDSRAPVLIADEVHGEACARLKEECPDLRQVLLINGGWDGPPPGLIEDNESANGAPDDEEFDRSQPHTLAYVMYTSGTTGVPKGVMVEHHSILRLVLDTNYIKLGPEDRILPTGSLSFDASTFELWGALLNGGALCIPRPGTLLDARALARLIRSHRVTTVWMTAGLFNALAADHIEVFDGLKTVLCGGEKVSAHHFRQVRRAHPGITLVNGYGPTENTTFTACYEVQQDFEEDVPIGAPIANTQIHILDEHLRPTAIGAAGELYAGGDGLARGYLNDPRLTAEKFVPHPWAAGERLYRTGDLARWRADGNVEYLGRTDDQVKIRGFRIEPAEIEARLLQYEQIKSGVVVARAGEGRDLHLVAYFTARGEVEVAALREYLSGVLPDYMMPNYFVRLERLPLTPNGKVDRRALPDPKVGARAGARNGQAEPASETEKLLLDIWREVLGQTDIGCEDNFFEHGGHSLSAFKLTDRVQRTLGFELPLTLVFKAPTVRELASCILDGARFGETAIDQPLVTFGARQEGGRILFGFPPGTADALGYAQLAERLKPHALHAFNFIEPESRIRDYADLIEGVDPDGPHVLFGYSGGGNLAFRTAVELERRGAQVSDVLMLDSSRFLRPFRFPPEEARRLASEFLDAEGVKEYVKSQVLRDKVVRNIERYYEFLSGAVEEDLIDANIHVVVSENAPDEYRDEGGRVVCSKSSWAELTRGAFRIRQGRGEHGHMLQRLYLEDNAALLREVINSIRTEKGADG
ncbi:MAG TPA: amino acid adenylation domain-containing protein [Pyrinomonadaceae bacterium]|nr:amino acid adenylation domain-containing protein [Pyrinomonadaceae bacterium]